MYVQEDLFLRCTLSLFKCGKTASLSHLPQPQISYTPTPIRICLSITPVITPVITQAILQHIRDHLTSKATDPDTIIPWAIVCFSFFGLFGWEKLQFLQPWLSILHTTLPRTMWQLITLLSHLHYESSWSGQRMTNLVMGCIFIFNILAILTMPCVLLQLFSPI